MHTGRASQSFAQNPWIGITYIPDNTRMEVPPAWFLAQIHDYDADLVLLPSRMRPYAYVVARRARLMRKAFGATAFDPTVTQPDTRMCWQYKVVPVCLMFKHGAQWSADTILAKLRARDLWAVGGGDAAADLLEQQEADEKKKQAQAKREELWHLSGEAWRSYQARKGQRVINNAVPTPTGAAK